MNTKILIILIILIGLGIGGIFVYYENFLPPIPDFRQLTFLEYACDPSWSPDGDKIVFCRIEGEKKTLYSINTDGSELKEIGSGFDPSWSPMENKIAYSDKLNGQIYTMDTKGENIVQLTTRSYNGAPAWSPDGNKIVYSHFEAGEASIWLMNIDGSEKTQLTSPADGNCFLPSFSYDGLKIVYVKGPIWEISEEPPTRPNQVWVMNRDGLNKHRIYAPDDSYQWIFQRAWNKNDKILFGRIWLDERKVPEIWLINSDGTSPHCILKSPSLFFAVLHQIFGTPYFVYGDPVWDKTGTKIAADKQIINGACNIVTFSWEE
jgi:Tol biopolymer transport system component